jgi:hypothetical protein
MTARGDVAGLERALDARILAAIAAWRRDGTAPDDAAFDALAIDLFAYHMQTNEPYRRFVVAEHGAAAPRSWRDIPAVPASAFKDATLATFDVRTAALEFHTSGTTASRAGRHYMQRRTLYDAALLAAFDRFMLPDGARLRYLNLVAGPRTNAHSSLGYMMDVVGRERGVGAHRSYVASDGIDLGGLLDDLADAAACQAPVCIAGTAFAFVALLDELAARGKRFACAPGSRIMETGGFKGRARVVERRTLYRDLAVALGIAEPHIVAEYGMTELTSQYYDAPSSREADVRVKVGPPWLRALVVDAWGRPCAPGETGFLRHVDLANRSSVIAVQTEDLAYAAGDGFVLLGRDPAAERRGCSLDAEELALPRA